MPGALFRKVEGEIASNRPLSILQPFLGECWVKGAAEGYDSTLLVMAPWGRRGGRRGNLTVAVQTLPPVAFARMSAPQCLSLFSDCVPPTHPHAPRTRIYSNG